LFLQKIKTAIGSSFGREPIRLNYPWLDRDELKHLRQVLKSGNLTQGAKVAEFEAGVRSLLGCKHAFATTSATTALHLSLVAMGIGPGDEVLVSDLSWPASGNVVVQIGARPVFVDVHPDTYAMNAEDLTTKVTGRSRAILVVHPFGLSADMEAIGLVARRHQLQVLEDAACALGSRFRGQACGTFGDAGCFSFHPRKIITTGEGGILATNRDDFARQIEVLRSHGGVRQEWRFSFQESGFNYRLSDLQAAVGVAQLEKISAILIARRRWADVYRRLLGDVEGLTMPVEPNEYFHTYQTFVVVLKQEYDRDAIVRDLRGQGIEVTLGTYAMHAEPFYRKAFGYRPGDLKTSYWLACQTLSLPLSPKMKESQLLRVREALRISMTKHRKTS
jgi:perosamine synthetase